jgi:hypothetical protein
MRAVDGLMATGGPTRATLDEGSVVTATDHKLSGGRLLLIVALQTERLIPGLQHLFIHRPVRIVTRRAVVSQRLMLEDIGPALRLVTVEAGVVRGRHTGAAPNHRVTLVRIMTVRTSHFAHRMRMGESKLTLLVRVTLETRARIFRGVNNVVRAAASLGVKATWTMAGFAPDVFARFTGRDELRMGSVVKRTINGVVALRTVF